MLSWVTKVAFPNSAHISEIAGQWKNNSRLLDIAQILELQKKSYFLAGRRNFQNQCQNRMQRVVFSKKKPKERKHI
jgi:hypothetical protein